MSQVLALKEKEKKELLSNFSHYREMTEITSAIYDVISNIKAIDHDFDVNQINQFHTNKFDYIPIFQIDDIKDKEFNMDFTGANSSVKKRMPFFKDLQDALLGFMFSDNFPVHVTIEDNALILKLDKDLLISAIELIPKAEKISDFIDSRVLITQHIEKLCGALSEFVNNLYRLRLGKHAKNQNVIPFRNLILEHKHEEAKELIQNGISITAIEFATDFEQSVTHHLNRNYDISDLRYHLNAIIINLSLIYLHTLSLRYLVDNFDDYVAKNYFINSRTILDLEHRVLKEATINVLSNYKIPNAFLGIEENPYDSFFCPISKDFNFFVNGQAMYIIKETTNEEYYALLPLFKEYLPDNFEFVDTAKFLRNKSEMVVLDVNSKTKVLPMYIPENLTDILLSFPEFGESARETTEKFNSGTFNETHLVSARKSVNHKISEYQNESFMPMVFGRRNGEIIKIGYQNDNGLRWSKNSDIHLGTTYVLNDSNTEIMSTAEVIDALINGEFHENSVNIALKYVLHCTQELHQKICEKYLQDFTPSNSQGIYAYTFYGLTVVALENIAYNAVINFDEKPNNNKVRHYATNAFDIEGKIDYIKDITNPTEKEMI